MGKKVRRKRQRSLFSMNTASEYSVLDSGRMGGGFDPLHLSRGSPRQRPSSSSGLGAWGVNGTEPPSLELLAEMIKEEIRQASGLKRALDRVGAEAEVMAQRVAGLAGQQTGNAQEDGVARRGGKGRQVHFVVPDDVRFRWLGIFQQPSESESESGSEDGSGAEDGSAAKAEAKTADRAEPKAESQTEGRAQTQKQAQAQIPAQTQIPAQAQTQAQAPRSPQTGRRITLGTGVRQGRVQAERQRARREAASAAAAAASTAAAATSTAAAGEEDAAYAGNSSVEAVYGGSRADARAGRAPAMQRTASAESSDSFEDVGQRRNSVDGSGARARAAAASSDEGSEGRRLVRRVTTTGGRGDEALGGILGGTRDFFKSRLRARAPGSDEGRTDSEVKERPRVAGRQASSAEYPRGGQQPQPAAEAAPGGRQRRNTDESTYGRAAGSDPALTPPPLPKMPPLPPLPTPSPPLRVPADGGDADSIDYHLRRLKGERKTRRSSFMATLSSMLGRKE